MAIADKLQTIISNNETLKGHIEDSLLAVADKGVTVPAGSKAENLPTLIEDISKSRWTGSIDEVGLRAIGWDDDDIAYFREDICWNSDQDDYYKVNPTLIAEFQNGNITIDNIRDYDSIVNYIPKLDCSSAPTMQDKFREQNNIIACPGLNASGSTQYMFYDCLGIVSINFSNLASTDSVHLCTHCVSLQRLILPDNTPGAALAQNCFSMTYMELPNMVGYIQAIALHSFALQYVKIRGILKDTGGAFWSAFNDCQALKTVDGIFDCSGYSIQWTPSSLWSLRHINVYGLHHTLSFANSSQFTNASIRYMIVNNSATEAITITLHADAYTRAIADDDILAALAENPLISLISA